MEESKKNTVKIVIIAACLASAGLVYYFTSPKGSSGSAFKAGEKTWIICRDCGETFEMEYNDYLENIPQNTGRMEMGRMEMGPPVLTCEKCGQDSAYKAIQCEKCQAVFEPGSVPRDMADRCPECDYSKIEESRQKNLEARRKSRTKSRDR